MTMHASGMAERSIHDTEKRGDRHGKSPLADSTARTRPRKSDLSGPRAPQGDLNGR